MKEHICRNPSCKNVTTNPKYCSKRCGVIVNNSKRPKRTAKTSGACERCETEIKYKKRSDRNHGGYQRRRFCDSCLPYIKSEAAKRANKHKQGLSNDVVSDMTKQELLEYYGNDPYKFKVKVTNHAQYIWRWLNRPDGCELCGFEFHNICHKKPVKEFDEDTKIKEINASENLIGLCPNHHWLLDRGKICQ